MSDASDHGHELHRYFSVSHAALISVRSEGVTLCQRLGSGWTVLARKKPECSLAQWQIHKAAKVQALPQWQREVQALPSMAELTEWNDDGVCETPTGDRVEPDGEGPDGVPSWLRLLRLI